MRIIKHSISTTVYSHLLDNTISSYFKGALLHDSKDIQCSLCDGCYEKTRLHRKYLIFCVHFSMYYIL
jgi:hypothetical protein